MMVIHSISLVILKTGGFLMQNQMFQQAKNAVNRMMNRDNGGFNEQDKQAAQNAIQSAYTNATAEEQQELRALEEQLKQQNELK